MNFLKLFSPNLILGLLLLFSPNLRAQDGVKRTEDVIYGRKYGTALTLDVFQPAKPNGNGILWMISGAFKSGHENINPASYRPLLERGYTVFAVVHGSQPKFTIHEIKQDINRAVRFTRHNAARFGVDPNHLGITGSSAGAHLSLSIGTEGGPGDANAPDPVDRESSAVQCVACFYPPTDFLNWSKDGDDGVGFGSTIRDQAAFGPLSYSAADRQILGRELSPIYHVTSNMPPTLIMHGDADKTVPIYQAKTFEARCLAINAPFKLIIKPGADHGWPGMDADMRIFADWFDEHLRGLKMESTGK
jgi:acetyl esterase/lipase